MLQAACRLVPRLAAPVGAAVHRPSLLVPQAAVLAPICSEFHTSVVALKRKDGHALMTRPDRVTNWKAHVSKKGHKRYLEKKERALAARPAREVTPKPFPTVERMLENSRMNKLAFDEIAMAPEMMRARLEAAAVPVDTEAWLSRLQADPQAATEHEYIALISAIAKQGNYERAMSVAGLMQRSGVPMREYTYSALVNACGESGAFFAAERVMDIMQEEGFAPTVVTYGALMKAYIKADKLEGAYDVLDRLLAAGLKPNVEVCTQLIVACVHNGLYERAQDMFDHMRVHYCQPDAVAYTAIITACGRTDQIEKVKSLMQEMQHQSVMPTHVTFNAAIHAMARSFRGGEEPHDLLHQMQAHGYAPDVQTYNSLLLACSHKGEVARARKYMYDLARAELQPTVVTYNTLLAVYARAVSQMSTQYPKYSDIEIARQGLLDPEPEQKIVYDPKFPFVQLKGTDEEIARGLMEDYVRRRTAKVEPSYDDLVHPSQEEYAAAQAKVEAAEAAAEAKTAAAGDDVNAGLSQEQIAAIGRIADRAVAELRPTTELLLQAMEEIRKERQKLLEQRGIPQTPDMKLTPEQEAKLRAYMMKRMMPSDSDGSSASEQEAATGHQGSDADNSSGSTERVALPGEAREGFIRRRRSRGAKAGGGSKSDLAMFDDPEFEELVDSVADRNLMAAAEASSAHHSDSEPVGPLNLPPGTSIAHAASAARIHHEQQLQDIERLTSHMSTSIRPPSKEFQAPNPVPWFHTQEHGPNGEFVGLDGKVAHPIMPVLFKAAVAVEAGADDALTALAETTPGVGTKVSLETRVTSLRKLTTSLWLPTKWMPAPIPKDPNLARNQYVAELNAIYRDMLANNLKPTAVTLNTMILAMSSATRMAQAHTVLRDEFPKHGLVPDERSYRPMVSAYVRLRQVKDAVAMKNECVEKGLVPSKDMLGELVHAYARDNDIKSAIEMLKEMDSRGYKCPEKFAFCLREKCKDLNMWHPLVPAHPHAQLFTPKVKELKRSPTKASNRFKNTLRHAVHKL